ncbi:unnamed protein product [Ascophyllum nodosum]
MCAWNMRSANRQTCFVLRTNRHRLREVQDRQIVSVCLGIEHMMKIRNKTEKDGRKRSGQDQGPHHHDERVCRLCQSTRRVLSTARAHASQKHDGRNCEACRMWAMVKARCASLRIAIGAGSDENTTIDGGEAAGAAGPSRPAVAPEGWGSSCE